MESFDAEGTFNEDYLWFYESTLTAERSRKEAAEIVETLKLDPGSSILDAPCGHGRISNLLALDGFRVTGVDVADLFLERAKTDRDELGVDVDYRHGDLRDLPVSGPFDAVVCWFTSFGTSMMTTTGGCWTSSPGCSSLADVCSSRRCTTMVSFVAS
jgi:2-polyprenyl-3-methyl-5-hydroxy-6-metoxy-1,4-benzoquinol methylase